MTRAVDEYDDIRTLLASAVPRDAPVLDVDAVIARGSRSRRVRRLDRWLAVAAALALVVGVGIAVSRLGGGSTSPVEPPSPSSSRSQSPTPAPTTAAEYFAAAQASIRDATNVRYVTHYPGGGTLDVVVAPHWAQGTLTAGGVTSRYVADESHVYVQAPALVALGFISAQDAAAARGRWVALIGMSPLNQPRTLFWLAASLDSQGSPPPTLGGRDRVTVTLVRTFGSFVSYLEMFDTAPYRPVQISSGTPRRTGATFTDWDTPDWDPSVTPPTFPAPNDVYDPSNPTP